MNVQSAEVAQNASALRRHAALRALSEARQSFLFGMRAARVIGFMIAAGGLILLFVVSGTRGRDALHVVVVRTLAWLSWSVGSIAALSATRDFAALDERDGIAALALERGYSERELGAARTAASVRVITGLLAVPALAVSMGALALSSSTGLLVPRVLLALGVLGYVAALGLALGIVARWSAAASPTHARVLLAVIVLGPELARAAWPHVPSLPAGFAWLLERLVSVGAAA